jgi:hypothetical protein
MKKACVTNRAPVMTAWATIVAERLGFRRQEALSIGPSCISLSDLTPFDFLPMHVTAQVYTSLNASSKGVSLGIMPPSALDSHAGPAQPFVDLMGRKVRFPLLESPISDLLTTLPLVDPCALDRQRRMASHLGRSCRGSLHRLLLHPTFLPPTNERIGRRVVPSISPLPSVALTCSRPQELSESSPIPSSRTN